MRILYTVIDGQISGGNNICVTLLRAALREGYHVELLTPSLGELTDILTEEGVKVHTLQMARSFHWHKAIQLARLLKERNIDLVHTHTSINSEILCRIACFLAGIPIICHQHDPTDVYNRNPAIASYQRSLDRVTSRLATKFVAVSEQRQQVMVVKRGYQPDKIQLVYNGIDVEQFSSQEFRESVRQQWSLNPQDIAIGLIARIEDPKGYGTLIEAVPLVVSRYPEAKFFLIGDDRWPNQPYLNKYCQQVKDLGISQSCFFLGFSPEVQKLIQGLDIVTLPSWWEGHPLILLEALAAKKPAIASAVGGVPEIVIHERTGLLIPPRNPQALANAICCLIERPELRKELAKNGYERVKELFNQNKMIEQVLSLYQSIQNLKNENNQNFYK